jgi:hypothetical protein
MVCVEVYACIDRRRAQIDSSRRRPSEALPARLVRVGDPVCGRSGRREIVQILFAESTDVEYTFMVTDAHQGFSVGYATDGHIRHEDGAPIDVLATIAEQKGRHSNEPSPCEWAGRDPRDVERAKELGKTFGLNSVKQGVLIEHFDEVRRQAQREQRVDKATPGVPAGLAMTDIVSMVEARFCRIVPDSIRRLIEDRIQTAIDSAVHSDYPKDESPRVPKRMHRGGVWPLTDADYDKLDPGIRGVVRFLVEQGFHTTDSGDGRTKVEEYGGDEDGEIMTVPHVAIPLDPTPAALAAADRLLRILKRAQVEVEPCMIELTYDPVQESCILMLTGVDDAMLQESE